MTQNEEILNYMQQYGSITQMDALIECGCFRLASRISDLKRQGNAIGSRFITVTTRSGEQKKIKEYFIAEEGQA